MNIYFLKSKKSSYKVLYLPVIPVKTQKSSGGHSGGSYGGSSGGSSYGGNSGGSSYGGSSSDSSYGGSSSGSSSGSYGGNSGGSGYGGNSGGSSAGGSGYGGMTGKTSSGGSSYGGMSGGSGYGGSSSGSSYGGSSGGSSYGGMTGGSGYGGSSGGSSYGGGSSSGSSYGGSSGGSSEGGYGGGHEDNSPVIPVIIIQKEEGGSNGGSSYGGNSGGSGYGGSSGGSSYGGSSGGSGYGGMTGGSSYGGSSESSSYGGNSGGSGYGGQSGGSSYGGSAGGSSGYGGNSGGHSGGSSYGGMSSGSGYGGMSGGSSYGGNTGGSGYGGMSGGSSYGGSSGMSSNRGSQGSSYGSKGSSSKGGEVAKGGPGLAFIAYPKGVAEMPLAPFGKFVLIEKWRNNERLLAPNELPIQLLNKWGDLANESDKLNKLQKELDSLEDTLSQRKKLIEHLTNDIKEANIEGLTLVPIEDQNGNLIEDENKPPINENYDVNDNRFNMRLGSTRRISGCPRELGNAVPTSKNPHGVWPKIRTSTPDEIQQRNKELWYAAGKQSNQRSLTPILKRRTNDLSPISPTSDYSETQSSSRGRQMNSSNHTNISGYESDASFSPRFRSVSPYRQKSVQIGPVTEMTTKSDYYRHKDAHHNKPLPGFNQFMGNSWPYGLEQEQENIPPRRSPILGSYGGSQQNLRSPSPGYYNQQEINEFPKYSKQDSTSSNYENQNNEREVEGDEYPLKRSLSKESLGPCQDIDGKGRFKNLPSNWGRSLSFFEEKREQVPVQHIKKVEPLNKYLKPQRINLSESTPNLMQDLNEKAKLQEIPKWLKDLKHIVVEQVPVPIPPRFGTLLHGRKNPDWALAPILDGPPCQLCRKPITDITATTRAACDDSGCSNNNQILRLNLFSGNGFDLKSDFYWLQHLNKTVEQIDYDFGEENMYEIRIKDGVSKCVEGFLGDGINDVLALKDSDIGISVDSGTEIAKDAADIVLLEKQLDVINDGVYSGRKAYVNTVKYISMAVSGNFDFENEELVPKSKNFVRKTTKIKADIHYNDNYTQDTNSFYTVSDLDDASKNTNLIARKKNKYKEDYEFDNNLDSNSECKTLDGMIIHTDDNSKFYRYNSDSFLKNEKQFIRRNRLRDEQSDTDAKSLPSTSLIRKNLINDGDDDIIVINDQPISSLSKRVYRSEELAEESEDSQALTTISYPLTDENLIKVLSSRRKRKNPARSNLIKNSQKSRKPVIKQAKTNYTILQDDQKPTTSRAVNFYDQEIKNRRSTKKNLPRSFNDTSDGAIHCYKWLAWEVKQVKYVIKGLSITDTEALAWTSFTQSRRVFDLRSAGLDIDHAARPAEMSRRKQTNPQPTKRTHERKLKRDSDCAINDFDEKDEEFLEDNSDFNKLKNIDQQSLVKMNQDENTINSEINNLKKHVNKKKRNNFCSSNNSSIANSPTSLKEDESQEEELMEQDVNEKIDNKNEDELKTIKAKRIKSNLSLNNQDKPKLIEIEEQNDKTVDDEEKKKDTMRALFNRLQGIDSESNDLLTVNSKKKKKMKFSKESKNSAAKLENDDEELNEENDDNEEEDQEDSENNKNNVNNTLKSSLFKFSSDVNNENENSLCTDKIKSKKREDSSKEKSKADNSQSDSEEMQCDDLNEDNNEDADEDDDDKKNLSLNQSWSSSGSSRNNLKTNCTKQLSMSPSNGLLSPTNDKAFVSNKKRKLNQQKTLSSTTNSKMLEQQNNLAAAEMLAKYQSQFAQLSQQILINSSNSNPINLASNENLMNSFLAAAASVNHNTIVPSPSPKPTSINTSSSLDKLTFIVDSIDKITVNQPSTKNSSNNNCLNTGTPTPGLSDSDNGSNLLLQLPTLSSLNKQAKTSPNAFGNSPATFQDVFNKLLPHQLLELQTTQLNSSSSANLFQPTPTKSPSSSSTHSSHSSSPSPNFFAKFVSNSANNQVNSPAPTLSSFASTLSSFGINKNLNNATNSSNSKKTSSSKIKNSSSINQNKQQNNLSNLLRQHAALTLLQQAENADDLFDNLDKDNDETEEDDMDQLGINSVLLKHLKKQMQKSKVEDNISIAPLDLSCKRDETTNSLNVLIASKLIENGGLNALFNSSLNNSSFNSFNSSNNIAQLNQLNNLLSANNLLNSASNQNSDKLNRIDLLSSLLGASTNTNSSTNLAAAAAAAATMSNPSAALLNFSLNQQLQNGPTNNSKNQKNSKESNHFKNQSLNAVSMLNNVLNSSNNSNLLSNATIAGHQLINPNSSNSSSSFWNNSKVKPYSATSSSHMPNPKSMQLRERSSSGQGRANPWQTQWMNRSSEQNRDVFTCVWCKMSFHSLDEMTQHMKISPRCGMAGMQQANAVSVANNSSSSVASHQSDHKNLLSNLSNSNLLNQNNSSSNLNSSKVKSNSSTTVSHSLSSSTSSQFSNKEKEKSNSQVPRKLVRGQDVWLGRGAEQTRQILKCIWCQESFKTLDELSKHMHVTQHFMNIISPEQITSWKTPEEKTQQSQMNQVLACKVCDESFSSLKELSSHIQKTSHFKNNNHMSNKSEQKTSLSALASITDKDRQSPSGLSTTSSSSTTGGNVNANSSSNGDQVSNNSQKKRNLTSNSTASSNNNTNSSTNKERRKKSLPVRKLLELERNVPLGTASNGLNNRDKQSNSEHTNLSRSFLESMNRLFGSSNNAEKSRNGYNLDNLSTYSDESENCSLNTSGNGNSYNNESSLNVNQSITCDECNEKMDFNQFIIHLKNCKPQFTSDQNEKLLNLIVAAAQQQQSLQCSSDNKSPVTINSNSDTSKNENLNEADASFNEHTKFNSSFNATPKDSNNSRQGTPERSDSRQSSTSSIASGSNRGTPQLPNGLTLTKKNNFSNLANTNKSKDEDKKNGSGSVISALEQLIEKSFDSKSKKSSTNLGILQRLGIDEEVCPPWQTNLTSATSPSNFASHIVNMPCSKTNSYQSVEAINAIVIFYTLTWCDWSLSDYEYIRDGTDQQSISNVLYFKPHLCNCHVANVFAQFNLFFSLNFLTLLSNKKLISLNSELMAIKADLR
ncbi:hypothetical protein RND71_043277 [Anisodus tanguticus]|uniref:C2H2-type domain-containing protein n=1 Tax=Anisodus tanguticus TaxID=243964 RepID=A0AAE1QQ99_9SOLA|nr:hypothetical protein RND71_043277 [Anisodus tanguticus]